MLCLYVLRLTFATSRRLCRIARSNITQQGECFLPTVAAFISNNEPLCKRMVAHFLQSDPPEIRRKIQALFLQDKLIEELTSRLFSAQLERGRLEKEIYEYRASVAPIQKCPEEILGIVFEYYLLENPRLICRLLLVCRNWYKVTVSSPRLWNRIPIKFVLELDAKSTFKSVEKRVDQCLTLSKSTPLELDLDFSEFISPEAGVRNIICKFLSEYVAVDGMDFKIWLESLCIEEPEIITICQYNDALNLLNRMIGDNGEVMSRWRSLDLCLPDDPFLALKIIEHFKHATPNLVRLLIIDTWALWDFSKPAEKLFPDLSSLQHFEVTNPIDLDFITPGYSSVHTLTFNDVTYWDPSILSRFTHLRKLEIEGWRYRQAELAPSVRTVVHLPELRQLIIKGLVLNFDNVEFQAPILDLLHLSRRHAPSFRIYPEVQAAQVHWGVVDDSLISEWTYEYIKSEPYSILLKYNSAFHLQVPRFSKEITCGIIRELKTQPNWSSALKSVSFEGRSGVLKTIEVDAL